MARRRKHCREIPAALEPFRENDRLTRTDRNDEAAETWRLHERIAANWLRRKIPKQTICLLLGFQPADLDGLLDRVDPCGFCPTPGEIAERAAGVRAGWSDHDRRHRAAGRGRDPGFSGPPVPQVFADGWGFTAVG